MMLSPKKLEDSILRSSHLKVDFVNGYSVGSYPNSSGYYLYVNTTGITIQHLNLKVVGRYVQGIKSFCMKCSNNNIATHYVNGGGTFCDTCYEKFKKYMFCTICSCKLNSFSITRNLRLFQTSTCRKRFCIKLLDVQYGKLCCTQAKYVQCNCAYSFTCPVHHKSRVCHGTHD